jgi:transcriptional regulator with XRE-family HTH domain
MYSQDIINKFIELRAQNISVRKIAEQIGVHRNTLLQWEHKYAEEIQNLRVLELEAIQERLLPSYEQQLTELAEEYKRVVAELRTRDVDYEPTPTLRIVRSPCCPNGEDARPAAPHSSKRKLRTNTNHMKLCQTCAKPVPPSAVRHSPCDPVTTSLLPQTPGANCVQARRHLYRTFTASLPVFALPTVHRSLGESESNSDLETAQSIGRNSTSSL